MFDTIAATATGPGLSAIGIIRLSGEHAVHVVDKIFRPEHIKSMFDAEPRKMYYGELFNTNGEVIDLCLCTVSFAPSSYTGEDTAELFCHGSPVVLREALEHIFRSGARQAREGEFTKRAFLNGRVDLTQAEAVVDLINAETPEMAVNAAGQLGGAVLKIVETMYSSLLDIVAHFCAVIDYPDEDIDDFDMQNYESLLNSAAGSMHSLLGSFERGKIMRNGVLAAILGKPNTGKSSLMNALLGYDRAIVTDIPGTTRDTIEERLTLGGILFRLTDTAGLRGTLDPVEMEGVKRAKSAAESAGLVLVVFDGSAPLDSEDFEVIESAKYAGRSIAVINKTDLPSKIDHGTIEAAFENICEVSALDGRGLGKLEAKVKEIFPKAESAVSGEILTNPRQFDAVSRALMSLEAAISALSSKETPDAVLTEVEAALSCLGELTGKTLREDVVERIFERFCVGK